LPIPLAQHLLVPLGCEGKDVGSVVHSKLLTAGCYIKAKSGVSVISW